MVTDFGMLGKLFDVVRGKQTQKEEKKLQTRFVQIVSALEEKGGTMFTSQQPSEQNLTNPKRVP